MAWNYKKSKNVEISEQKKEIDPRSKTSWRGKSYIASGDKNPVKGTRAARPQKPVTWT